VHHYGADGHIRKTQRMYDTHTLIPQVLRINLFITLDYVLQKKSTEVDPHYLDVWAPAHEGDATTAEKLVSNNFYRYTSFVISD
jgi:hypothetical protein